MWKCFSSLKRSNQHNIIIVERNGPRHSRENNFFKYFPFGNHYTFTKRQNGHLTLTTRTLAIIKDTMFAWNCRIIFMHIQICIVFHEERFDMASIAVLKFSLTYIWVLKFNSLPHFQTLAFSVIQRTFRNSFMTSKCSCKLLFINKICVFQSFKYLW